jgi:transposase
VQQALPHWTAAGIYLVFLPAYCPELSGIEPLWQTVKHHAMPKPSFVQLG